MIRAHAHSLGLAVGLSCVAASVQAGAWDVFAAHCLQPMENFASPHAGAFETQRVMSDATPACWLTTNDVTDRTEAQAWQEQAVATGRYEQIEGVLLSTLWREPRLQVDLQFEADRLTFIATETDLES